MSKIRINELARQLEVKSRQVIEKLQELGIAEKVTHSSSIDDDMADRLRRYYSGEIAAGRPYARKTSAEDDHAEQEEAEREEAAERHAEVIATPAAEAAVTPAPSASPAPAEAKIHDGAGAVGSPLAEAHQKEKEEEELKPAGDPFAPSVARTRQPHPSARGSAPGDTSEPRHRPLYRLRRDGLFRLRQGRFLRRRRVPARFFRVRANRFRPACRHRPVLHLCQRVPPHCRSARL